MRYRKRYRIHFEPDRMKRLFIEYQDMRYLKNLSEEDLKEMDSHLKYFISMEKFVELDPWNDAYDLGDMIKDFTDMDVPYVDFAFVQELDEEEKKVYQFLYMETPKERTRKKYWELDYDCWLDENGDMMPVYSGVIWENLNESDYRYDEEIMDYDDDEVDYFAEERDYND